MCGIMALLLADAEAKAAPEINEGLSLLQHRGQDAAGITTCKHGGQFFQCKANGMVRDVIDASSLSRLQGRMGIGHVRYPTAGSSNDAEAQPFYVNYPCGIVLAHNGNLINTSELREYLVDKAFRHLNTQSDSEVLLNIFADELMRPMKAQGKNKINEEDVFTAIEGLMKKAKGGYTCVAMVAGFGIIAFRDPNGIRPLGLCSRPSIDAAAEGLDYCFTSESCVSAALEFENYQDVQPGECVIYNKDTLELSRRVLVDQSQYTFAPDIFEYVYFARSDSVMDGISVYQSRINMGVTLARTIRRRLKAQLETIDIIVPVPDTSRVAALQVSKELGVDYREAFVKNPYVGRTFIMPGQSVRRKNVRRKLNAMETEFRGKKVCIVDDSIVRGTTSREIIQMARDAGAKTVVMASCAPPIRFSNVYGIDMPSRRELVAHGRTEEEVAEHIQADMVIYQTLEDLVQSVRECNPAVRQFDCSVFNGQYVTGGVDDAYLQGLETLRSDNAKIKAGKNSLVMVGPAGEGANDPKMAAPPGEVVRGGGRSGAQVNGGSHAEESERGEQHMSCQGPMNGADALGSEDMALYNSRSASQSRQHSQQMGI